MDIIRLPLNQPPNQPTNQPLSLGLNQPVTASTRETRRKQTLFKKKQGDLQVGTSKTRAPKCLCMLVRLGRQSFAIKYMCDLHSLWSNGEYAPWNPLFCDFFFYFLSSSFDSFLSLFVCFFIHILLHARIFFFIMD